MAFHTYHEACECIAAGGMARRFGSPKRFYMGWRGLEADDGHTVWITAKVDVQDQLSADWILTDPDSWKAIQEAERRKREEFRTDVPPPPPRRADLWTRFLAWMGGKGWRST